MVENSGKKKRTLRTGIVKQCFVDRELMSMVSLRRKVKRYLFSTFLEKNSCLLEVSRKVQFALWQQSNKLGRIWNSERRNVNEILWVDPRTINLYIGDLPWSRFSMRGRIEGGDWDLASKPFAPTPVNRAIEARFIRGESWKSTRLYELVSKEIEAGAVRWGCSSIEAFEERLARLEQLYREISENGYKSQEELSKASVDAHTWEKTSPFNKYDEVTICIDRHGRMLLRDGKHRLAMAKAIGIPQIPVVVGLRHREWQAFRQEVRQSVGPGCDPHALFPHPDLQGKEEQCGRAMVDLMLAQLKSQNGSLLDLGARFGFYCHQFERAGFECMAVEANPKRKKALEKLRVAQDRKFEVISPADLDERASLRYDVVLALDALHRYFATPESFNSLRLLLNRVDTKALFFQPHDVNDPAMQGAYRNPSPEDFVRLVMEYTGLSRVRQVSTSSGRPLYIIER